MNTLTQPALGLIGQLKPLPPAGDAAALRWAGLATVIRAWFNRDALAGAMGWQASHQLLLSQAAGGRRPD